MSVWWSLRVIRSLGTGVTGSFEPPGTGAGSWAWVLCKNSTHWPLSHLLQSHRNLFKSKTSPRVGINCADHSRSQGQECLGWRAQREGKAGRTELDQVRVWCERTLPWQLLKSCLHTPTVLTVNAPSSVTPGEAENCTVLHLRLFLSLPSVPMPVPGPWLHLLATHGNWRCQS